MPFDLSYVVRPFVTPNAHGQIIIPSTPRGSHERATLTWGGGAFQLPERKEVSDGVEFNVVCCQEALSEKSRISQRERVYQNDDQSSDSWVDVERPTSVRLQKKSQNSCGDDWGQTEGTAQAVNPALDQYGNAMSSGVVAKGDTCSVGWTFVNE
jgi:hypothetical protein